jgi:hypothetical protein
MQDYPVAGGAEIPGGVLGIAGGVTIDLDTGKVTGGSVGAEGLGVGVNVSVSEDGIGVEVTWQIPFSPFEVSLGLGFPGRSKPNNPTPPPEPENSPRPGVGSSANSVFPLLKNECFYEILGLQHGAATQSIYKKELIRVGDHPTFKLGTYTPQAGGGLLSQSALPGQISNSYIEWHDYPVTNKRAGYKINNANYAYLTDYWINSAAIIKGDGAITFFGGTVVYSSGNGENTKNYIQSCLDLGGVWEFSVIESFCYSNPPETPPKPITPIDTGTPINTGGGASSAPPFPNPPPRKQNMDDCCRETTKLLRVIHKRLGISKFPGQLPATIIQEVPKEGEQPAEPPQVPIEDFVDLLDWQFRRDDERWGQWEVQINVKDADLTEEGNQSKQIKFPNLAESIAELEGQMLSVMANVDALVAITTKNLVESGMARQESIKSYLAAKAIIKYMAFKSTEIDVPVPMTFTPGAETISALIQESEGHIKGTDYVEKETLRDIYLDLLQAAAIIRAVHWQKIDSKNDTKTQLLNILKGTVDLAGLVSNPKKGSNGEEEKFDPAQNFEDFIDSVEDGFRNTTGISDIQNPYGRTPDRRPRIREIGDNLSEAGGDN